MRYRMIATLVIAAAFLWAITAAAQSTTGRLMGTVVDDSGAALPGVTVTIDSPALIGGARTKVTDHRGEVVFLSLVPGEYLMTSALSGFDTQKREKIQVPLGGSAVTAISMPLAAFEGEISVTDEPPVIDTTQVNTGQVFRQDYLQGSAIGSGNRDYATIINQTAGVVGGYSWGGVPQSRVFGSTIGENAYFIDGMDATNPTMATATLRLNYDAIGEIQMQTGGFEAEYGRATGGIINLVSKSGGNQFAGTFDIRYRNDSFQESGDHFDSSDHPSQYAVLGATLGGPILRDRVWFFASYGRTVDDFTPADSPTTEEFDGQTALGKITWQISPGWRLAAKATTDPHTVHNWNASRTVMPEATNQTEKATTIFSTELNSVLSDALMWNTTLGSYYFDSKVYPNSGNLSAIGHYNFDTRLNTGNYGNQQYWNTSRVDMTTDLTWFVDGLTGSHEFKGGIEYSDLGLTATNCSTGTPNGERCVPGGVGFFFQDIELNGTVPLFMWEDYTSGPTDYDGAVSTAFVQDAWRPNRNLTLKLGLRYDLVTYDTNTGLQIADMDMFQPRIGVAWDVVGDTKNILRASWGRFMHPNMITLPSHVRELEEPSYRWYSCSGVLPIYFDYAVSSVQECMSAASAFGWEYRTDNENWDPYGWVLAPGEYYASEPNQIDPNIRPTYADELILSFERELGSQTSIELSFIDKKTRDVIDDTCNGNWPFPSADAACDYFVNANFDILKRDYRGLTLTFETRRLSWLSLLASYTYSSSKGSIEYTQGQNTATDIYPYHYDNWYGHMSDHRKHRIKLNGFAILKGDWTIGLDAWWTSAIPYALILGVEDVPGMPWGYAFHETWGSREANDNYRLDLQLSKGFRVGPVRLVIIGTVLNALGTEQPWRICAWASGCGADADGNPIEFGKPENWQIPRRYEIGFRVEF